MGDETNKDLRIAYQILVEDIRHTKARQWTLTYYVLLLFVAIIGFKRVLLPVMTWQEEFILFLISFLLGVWATVCLRTLQEDMRRYRERLQKLDSMLSCTFQQNCPVIHDYNKLSYNWKFLWTFIITIWVGVIFVGWLLLKI